MYVRIYVAIECGVVTCVSVDVVSRGSVGFSYCDCVGCISVREGSGGGVCLSVLPITECE